MRIPPPGTPNTTKPPITKVIRWCWWTKSCTHLQVVYHRLLPVMQGFVHPQYQSHHFPEALTASHLTFQRSRWLLTAAVQSCQYIGSMPVAEAGAMIEKCWTSCAAWANSHLGSWTPGLVKHTLTHVIWNKKQIHSEVLSLENQSSSCRSQTEYNQVCWTVSGLEAFCAMTVDSWPNMLRRAIQHVHPLLQTYPNTNLISEASANILMQPQLDKNNWT